MFKFIPLKLLLKLLRLIFCSGVNHLIAMFFNSNDLIAVIFNSNDLIAVIFNSNDLIVVN
jgi:hypothetical protein